MHDLLMILKWFISFGTVRLILKQYEYPILLSIETMV